VTKLSEEEAQVRVAALTDWAIEGDEIAKTFKFTGFADSVAFVVRLGFAAEKADHHPDLDIRYNRVRVALSTHSEGGLTEKDFALAGIADTFA
jgi:4a-hydroxytetrahydrobiopterin dehydratase